MNEYTFKEYRCVLIFFSKLNLMKFEYLNNFIKDSSLFFIKIFIIFIT